MKLTKKRISIVGLSALCVMSVAAGASLLANNSKATFAQDSGAPSAVYYYDNLTDNEGKEYTLAKKFYDALDTMNKNGDFKDGVVDYDLKDMLTSDQIQSWVSGGDLTVPKAFSAARDSYYYDHPELFYIDIYKITLSAGRMGDTYVAYINCGREANLYAEGGFTSEIEVEKAITAYNAKIDEVVAYAKDQAEKDTYDIAKEVLLARYANQYIASHTEYDEAAAVDSTITTGSNAQTAYGALVAGTAVCNGYSRAFKAVMDKLEIPCIVVGGYSVAKNSHGDDAETNSKGKIDNMGEPHAWNYVWYINPVVLDEIDVDEEPVATYAEGNEGRWYSYDVTWNSTAPHTTLVYCDMGALSDAKYHSADGEVSTTGYILPYPELSTFNYGCANATNGLSRVGIYSATDSDEITYDDYGNPSKVLQEYISYNGKGADKLLKEDGLHIIFRYQGYEMSKDGKLTWTKWASVSNTNKAFGWEGDENPYQSMVPAFYTGLYSQFAVTDLDPDLNEIDQTKIKYYYTDEELLGEHIIDITGLYENKTFGTYLSAPHVVATAPIYTEQVHIRDSMAKEGTSMMDEQYAFTLSVTYNEPLRVFNPDEPIGINFNTRYPYTTYPLSDLAEYAVFVPVDREKYGDDLVVLEEDGCTLTFRFMPSLLFKHNNLLYSFQFTNVVSDKTQYRKDGTTYTTDKLPNAAPFIFCRETVFCPRMCDGGRLWVDVCAFPQLVSNSNLAEMDFIDENGSTFTTNMSQMMLVVESVDEKTENEILNGIAGIENSNVTREDIKKSETYDIDLQHCGKYTSIPDGARVKISLGFPEGMSYESLGEGVAFKIYHRKHIKDDEYIIEELPCVVTPLGIIVSTRNFSPYMVAAVDASKISSDKYIYAAVDGRGGKLSGEDDEIKTVKEGETVSFAIAPDEGYQLYKVTLNDKDITDKVVDGTLTLTYAELDSNNEVEIQYIANAAVKRLAEKEIEVIEPVKVVVSTDGKSEKVEGTGGTVDISRFEIPDDNNGDKKPGNTALIIACVAIAVVVVLGGSLAFVIIKKRRAYADYDDYDEDDE